MKKRLTRLDPFQTGKVSAALYLGLSLLFVPFFLLISVIGSSVPHQNGGPNPFPSFAGMGLVFVIVIPVFYTILGFIGGAVGALIYNLVARFTGGLEMTFVDVVPDLPLSSSTVYPTQL